MSRDVNEGDTRQLGGMINELQTEPERPDEEDFMTLQDSIIIIIMMDLCLAVPDISSCLCRSPLVTCKKHSRDEIIPAIAT